MRVTGRYESTGVAGEAVRAFIPLPLPPSSPALVIDVELAERIRRAEESMRLLNLAGAMVPDVGWFVYAFVRKEAVVSSQIEGTQATLVDLFAWEAEPSPGAPIERDVEEVCNHLDAITWARAELARDDGMPLSVRLLHEAHRRLMSGARGADKNPGQPRRTQNWIGGARLSLAAFVPPPTHLVPDLLSDLEKYLHAQDDLSPIVRAALVHVQFETIHPYLDGNGRLGRLLVSLMLEAWGLLQHPLLYLSLHFKRHRSTYYELLTGVRERGEWEAWVRFFLDGVVTIAAEAATTARDLFAQTSADQARVLAGKGTSVKALRLLALLPRHPMVTIPRAATLLSTSIPTATKAIMTLVDEGVLQETSGRKRDRTFAYGRYLEILRVGTDLPPDVPRSDVTSSTTHSPSLPHQRETQ